MDIVSRLKEFISYLQLTNSQFADSCHIPRPSLSQLLNGRNKKVSDEIVAKIHDAFPQLSVLWLLFGEGQMVANENIQFSEPQNPVVSPLVNTQSTTNQSVDSQPSSPVSNTTFSSENFQSSNNTPPPTSIKLNTAPNKRISTIVVFYDDNSFQSFSPS